MTVNIKARNIELTSSLEFYIHQKIGALRRFIKPWEDQGAVHMDFEVARTSRHHHKGKEVYYAEANMVINGVIVRVTQYSDDLRKAIDFVKNTLRRVINKYKPDHR